MPKSQKPKPGPDASDSLDVEPPAEASSGSDLDAIMAAIKQTEQSVLTKIDSSVMAAAGKLDKKIDSLASDLRTEIPNVRVEFKKVTEEVQKENATFSSCIGDLEEEANGNANRVVALEAKVNALSTQFTHHQIRPKIWSPGSGESGCSPKGHECRSHHPQRLRLCTGVKYGLLYPATLKITTPAGEQVSFDDPTKAKHYIETNLRPRETEGE
ncbi:hypothetical protein JOB18_016505 [Xyrichtys novacula]|uniref:Uncharacterized protein n=1 Tax=Xyrichtys novacula TaxID=13765 RepID=A0AAV1H5T7_XYRNO|nr:hypothetical protein JOB18_016505 [Xyrichtys novacula]